MKNRIIELSKQEIDIYRKKIISDKNVFLAEINGEKINNESDYVKAMVKALKIPFKIPFLKLGYLEDCICDLMWIKAENIVIIIHSFDLMLIEDVETKNRIITFFQKVVLPWWEGEVVGHMVDGKPRAFSVYLEQ